MLSDTQDFFFSSLLHHQYIVSFYAIAVASWSHSCCYLPNIRVPSRKKKGRMALLSGRLCLHSIGKNRVTCPFSGQEKMSLPGLVWINCDLSLNHIPWAQGIYACILKNQHLGSKEKDLVRQEGGKTIVGVCY